MPLTNPPQSADHLAGEAGSFEPQRGNNFSVELALSNGDDKDVIIMALEGFTLPTITNEKVELHYQNGVVFVAGKAKTEDGSLVVKDFVDRDVLGAMLRWRKQVHNAKTGQIGYAKDYKVTGSLVMTGPDGTTERVCKLRGLWPLSDPKFTDFAMGSSEAIKLSLQLSCDRTDWSGSISGLD